MSEESLFNTVFSSILSHKGVTAPLERLELEGIHDEPGFHWSNPGIKMVSAFAGGIRYPFVLKRLSEHSKREALVYKFLSEQEGFPIPRLFYDMYDDDRKEYWMVIERCVGRDFTRPEDFWEQCGLLLARIHATFWDKVDTLPGLFYIDIENERLQKAVDRLTDFLGSLVTHKIKILDNELGLSFNRLRSALDGVVRERLPELPKTGCCLLHGAFHSPEIMWREISGEYIPLGVDWERSRVGIPAEDLTFGVTNLLAKGENALFETFLDTYLSELRRHGITLDRDEVSASIRHEALVHMMGAVIPFVLQTYLRVHHDESFTEWCQWVRQDIPDTLRFLQSEIESDRIYGE